MATVTAPSRPPLTPIDQHRLYLAAARRADVASHQLHPCMLTFTIRTRPIIPIDPSYSEVINEYNADTDEGAEEQPSTSLVETVQSSTVHRSISTLEPNLSVSLHHQQPLTNVTYQLADIDELEYEMSKTTS